MTTPYERAVESLRAVSHQMDAADLSASDLVMAMVAVNVMNAEIASLRKIEETARALADHHDYIVLIRDGKDAPYCTKAAALLAALAQPKEADRE